MRRERAFTVIELLVTLAILGVLSVIVLPLAELTVQRSREAELRQALQQLRAALDAYKLAYDEGRIARQLGASGYPPSLDALVEGVEDVAQAQKTKQYFLRRVPRDPFQKEEGPPRWGLRSYRSSATAPEAGDDVFDVYSLSTGVGLDGTAYRQW
ncbi:MAG: prepilin-type N-terminal cleavage/methylation domain-containing protein [Burkholderiaceae bacterium]|jgi:general secretion pathway protein G